MRKCVSSSPKEASLRYRHLIQEHIQAMKAVSSEKTRLWWETYMKHVIPFRGVGIPVNRQLLSQWRTRHGIDTWPLEDQLELALAFFREPAAEDKLAGVLYLQNYLFDKLPWHLLLERYADVYAEELIFDWNVCDWFCVRVLGPTLKKNGKPCAVAIMTWKDDPYLWKARSSLVPFVSVASEPDYYPFIRSACEALIKREERFSKTAVGWVLHDISKFDRHFVLSFIDENLKSFSKESLSNALKYFEAGQKNKYLKMLKNT